ncbi:sodium:solute symporter [Fictibacillus barbaricus]|uniref:Sodium:solute symporter n=1 Tax=Fictibacillus barbaricus TaxID=182136 RepID=A0ABS2ZF35_9BACL|nr:sodium:solute symporter [Fictibacillus barbaricus]MBN3545216.1 sodium:solute symporter [Fictibacillus barbaricus]GGB60738.1 sodium:solute symport protein [Fictibacillus barbaricus]
MQALDTVIILLYFAVLIGAGIIGSTKAKTSEDFNLAGRNLGMFMYLGCLSAVILGGAATIGTTKLGYQFGISGIWFVSMIGLGIILLGTIFLRKIDSLKVTTISELLGKRYKSETRLLSAIVASIYTLMIAVTQVIGMGTIINVLLGWNITTSMLVGGGIVLFYTILGGMWSVTVTDIIQFVVMTVGIFFIMLPMSVSKVDGFGNLLTELPKTHLDFSTIGYQQIFQYFLLFALGMVVSQDIWQRVFTAKSGKIARNGSIFAGIYSFAYAIAGSIIGMCAFIVLPNLDDPQNTFAEMALTILPTGILGLVLASVCSALMSTASGSLLASSTLITNDILKQYFLKNPTDKQLIRTSRITTLFIGLIAITFSIWIQDVLVALDVAYAILSGAIFIPLVMTFFWKRATPNSGFYAILISTIVVLAGLFIEGLTSTNPILYGMSAGLISIIGISLFTAPTSEFDTPFDEGEDDEELEEERKQA